MGPFTPGSGTGNISMTSGTRRGGVSLVSGTGEQDRALCPPVVVVVTQV